MVVRLRGHNAHVMERGITDEIGSHAISATYHTGPVWRLQC